MAKTGREVKHFAHLPGCPRLMFWDAGDDEARCDCDYDDSEEWDETDEALFKSETARDHALSRVRFLRRMMEECIKIHPESTSFLEHALKSDAEDADNHV